jgi:rod shape determining protein RodA
VRYAVVLAMALVISRLPRELVQLSAYPVYGIILALLVAVDAIGAMGGGARRWLDLGFIRLQPSELMKPGIVLVLASFYHSLPAGLTSSWRSLAPAGALILVPVGLVLLQPDLGTGLAITFGGVVVMFLAGLPARWFAGAGVSAVVVAPLAFFFALHDYQRQRVLTFLDP